MNNKFFQKPTLSLEQFCNLLRNVPKSKIKEIVKKARELGISEDYIKEGLKLINTLKKSH